MKVNDTSLNQSAASQLAKAQQAEAAGTGAKRGTGAPGSADADRVQLSDLSGRLLNVQATESTERAARVERLAAEYRSGRYQADAGKVASALIDDAFHNET